jgi:uncharacterized protein YybS (DUF2232 family)
MVTENNTRALANSAIATALSVIIALIGLFVPLLSFASLLWPVPIIITIKRYGIRYGILSTIASGLIVGMMSEPIYAVYVTFGFGALGLTIGWGVQRDYSAARILMIASLASLVSKVLLIFAATKIMGVNPIELQLESMQQAFELSTKFYQDMGLDSTQNIADMFSKSFEMLKLTMPAILVFASVADSFMNYTVSRIVLKRFKLNMKPLPPFGEWRFPGSVSLGLVFLIVLTYIGGYLGLKDTQVILGNVLMLFNLVFLIQGLSLLYYFMTVKGWARFLKVLLMVLVMFNQGLSMVVVLAGLLDGTFNLRRYIG